MKNLRASRSALAFSQLPSAPPPGSIQCFDGLFPALAPGSYSIALSHSVPGPAGQPAYQAVQAFDVQAPEFGIDTTIVQAAYPPPGGADAFDQCLPFVVMADPVLPWERALVPGQPAATEGSAQPWLALMLFTADEVTIAAGSTDPTVSMTVADLLGADPAVLKPDLPSNWVTADVQASQCKGITVTAAAFAACAPRIDELPLLSHVRSVNSGSEGQHLVSVVLANRLPVGGTGAVRWYAHLVSLEGFGAYLGPSARPIPAAQTHVMLASLYNWTFVTLPDTGFNFAQLADGLVASEAGAGRPGLGLPVPDGAALPAAVAGRLADGYAPVAFNTRNGEQSFAWYRGPFTPSVAQPLPALGSAAIPAKAAPSADALMVYLPSQGVFDLSYAAAWEAGRSLALADSSFAQAVHALRLDARGAVTTLAQRMAMPHFAGSHDPAALLGRGASRKQFAALVHGGLGRRWHAAVGAARAPMTVPQAAAMRALPRRTGRRMLRMPEVMALPGVPAALAAQLAEKIAPVAKWLARAVLLENLPFSHLVPDPRMLPVESVRFFHVDQGWLDAFTAGALSLAVHSSTDVEIQRALWHALLPPLDPASSRMSGMLIRSQMVADTPQLRIDATMDGAPLTVVRDALLAPGVRLTLFQGVPDEVTIAQPYHGLVFGIEDGGIAPRAVTGGPTGAQLAGAAKVPVGTRPPAAGMPGGVIEVAELAAALATAAGVAAYSKGAVVHWNGTALATTYAGPNQLSAVVPASLLAKPADAVITVTDNGVTSAPARFSVEAAYSLDALAPSALIAGAPDLTLTAEGQGFAQGAVLQWDGAALPTQVVSPTMLLAQVGAARLASAGAANISVLSGGTTSNAVTLSIRSGQPEIDQVSPSMVAAGADGFTLAVTGSGFAAGAVVQWNGAALVTSRVDDAHLNAAVPGALVASAGAVSIVVAASGTTSNAQGLTIAPGGLPLLATLGPQVTIAGAGAVTLLIGGANFTAGATALANGTALATTFGDAGQVSATLPASLLAAGTLLVTVKTAAGESNALPFTVLPVQAPSVGLLVPNAAAAGSADLALAVYGGFGAGDFALQMVKAPELLAFLPMSAQEEK